MIGILLTAAILAAPTPDQQAALAAADAFLAALSAGDTAKLAALSFPDGAATATGIRDGKPVLRRMTWAQFIEANKPGPDKVEEKMTGAEVRTEGDIAMVWGRYRLTINGRLSHCGVDHFDLLRQDGRWKVLNVTWSQQVENCPGG